MQFARGDMTVGRTYGDDRCADGVWKGRGIGRVCRTGGVFGITSGVLGRGGKVEVGGKSRSCCQAWGVARGGQAGCRMPGPEMGHGVRAGPERPARSAELSWKGSRGEAAQLLPGFRTALLRPVSGGHGGGLFTCGGRCCGRRGLLYLQRVLWAERTFIFAAGAAGRRALSNCLASLHVCSVPLRLFDPCGGRVAATAHVRHKSGKSGFSAVAESAFPAFVYLRYFCRDTAPATGSNSS